MNPWTAFVHALQGVMASVAGAAGVSLGIGILLTVLAIRLALIPIMLPLAARSRDHNRVARTLRPQLATIKKEFRKDADPMREQREISALHARHGISVVDVSGLVLALIQLPVMIALFQAVFHVTRNTTLASPGILAGILASVLSVASVWVGEQADSKALLALYAVLPLGIALWLGQGIGLYMIAFYAGSTLQAALMRRRPNTVKPVESPA